MSKDANAVAAVAFILSQTGTKISSESAQKIGLALGILRVNQEKFKFKQLIFFQETWKIRDFGT
jgi:hypothetical protein